MNSWGALGGRQRMVVLGATLAKVPRQDSFGPAVVVQQAVQLGSMLDSRYGQQVRFLGKNHRRFRQQEQQERQQGFETMIHEAEKMEKDLRASFHDSLDENCKTKYSIVLTNEKVAYRFCSCTKKGIG